MKQKNKKTENKIMEHKRREEDHQRVRNSMIIDFRNEIKNEREMQSKKMKDAGRR